MASGGAFTPTILARMVVTAPVISSTVSPRTRRAMSSPPICEGVASPDIMLSNAAAASWRVKLAPVATLAMSALNSSAMELFRCRERSATGSRVPGRGNVDKVLQYQMAVLGSDAFRVKLYAVYGKVLVHYAHAEPVARFGIDGERAWHTSAFHDQGMIPRRPERSIDADEKPSAAVADLGQLSMHRRGPHDLAAERLADCLMTEADAEDRDLMCRLFDQIEADACFGRGAGTRREHDSFRARGNDRLCRDLVIAMDDNLISLSPQIMYEVECKAVVVVDQDDHVCLPVQRFTAAPMGGQASPLFGRGRRWREHLHETFVELRIGHGVDGRAHHVGRVVSKVHQSREEQHNSQQQPLG